MESLASQLVDARKQLEERKRMETEDRNRRSDEQKLKDAKHYEEITEKTVEKVRVP